MENESAMKDRSQIDNSNQVDDSLLEILRLGDMRLHKMYRICVFCAEAVVFVLAGVLAFVLRFDLSLPASRMHQLGYALVIWSVIKSLTLHVWKLDRGMWRYVSVSEVKRLISANIIASTISGIVILVIVPPQFPRSIYFIDFILAICGTCGLRLVVRMTYEASRTVRQKGKESRRTVIYGAGYAGIALLREIRHNGVLPYDVVGFIDDSLEKKRLLIADLPVVGNGDDLKAFVKRKGIEVVLIAIPSASGLQMTRILDLCRSAGVECKTVPGLAEIMERDSLAGQIREVSVEDLLGRVPVQLEGKRIRGALEGKVVLVTGAAGSIGSELCRQIARFRPERIVGFEIAESPLFEFDREMRQAFPDVPFFAEIGSIQNRARIDEVLSRHRPSAIYHAAAYKHVPLMETHVFEAVENNVFGTYNVAVSGAKHGVEDFVLISSDKAVRPTNVMGATKRVAELLLLALQNGSTKCVAVRFGNVLGSNGSVIPIFKKQIASGGPVTVTHPEMRRFFMTIPEACQLVLQAGVIGNRGQVCVLDMGQAVKIVDLARNLILLSGLRPDEDIEIKFTGTRPGEKLYEELNTLLEDTVPTTHEKIRVFIGNGMPAGDIQNWLGLLHDICEARDTGRLVVALKELVLDYNPSTYLLKHIIQPLTIMPVAGAVDSSNGGSQAELPNGPTVTIGLRAAGK
jgi:FlaA1/EpsC-like NDP-sugar epimerase